MRAQSSSRQAGEMLAQYSVLRLICGVSVWRTAMTRILPCCGASAWWVMLACLLPGFIVGGLLRWSMSITKAATLQEMVRCCIGRGGAALLAAALTLPLLAEGVSGMTALITLFTEGVGTRGTQLTLAILTSLALLGTLHRDGLARGVYFIRGVLVTAALLMAGYLLSRARLDHIYPLWGQGRDAVLNGVEAGMSLAWPVALLLTAEPLPGQGRLRSAMLPVFGAVGALLVTSLSIPHEVLIRQEGLARFLLLPGWFLPNALRVVWLCLVMLLFFLTIGAVLQQIAVHAASPAESRPAWLPYALLGGLVLTQAVKSTGLWAFLGVLEPWLLLPLAALALLLVPIAMLRRRKI